MTQVEHRWYVRSPDQEKHAHMNNHIKLLRSRPFKNIELFSNKQIKWKSGRNENGQIFLAFAVRNLSLDPWLKWNEVQCLHRQCHDQSSDAVSCATKTMMEMMT